MNTYVRIYGGLCSIDNNYERDCKITLRGETLEYIKYIS